MTIGEAGEGILAKSRKASGDKTGIARIEEAKNMRKHLECVINNHGHRCRGPLPPPFLIGNISNKSPHTL